MGFNYSPNAAEELTSFGGNACFNVVIWQAGVSLLTPAIPPRWGVKR